MSFTKTIVALLVAAFAFPTASHAGDIFDPIMYAANSQLKALEMGTYTKPVDSTLKEPSSNGIIFTDGDKYVALTVYKDLADGPDHRWIVTGYQINWHIDPSFGIGTIVYMSLNPSGRLLSVTAGPYQGSNEDRIKVDGDTCLSLHTTEGRLALLQKDFAGKNRLSGIEEIKFNLITGVCEKLAVAFANR